MPQQDGLIVLSGGMDSVTLLYEYQANIALAISFDYGSKHNAQEIPYARLHCERLGIEHLTISPPPCRRALRKYCPMKPRGIVRCSIPRRSQCKRA